MDLTIQKRAAPRPLQQSARAMAHTHAELLALYASSVRVEDVGAALSIPDLNGRRGVVFLGGLWALDAEAPQLWTTCLGDDDVTDPMNRLVPHLARFAKTQGLFDVGSMPIAAFTPEQVASSIQAELLRLALLGTIPTDVADFSAVHDHVDGNMLGLAELCSVAPDCSASVAILNEAQELVDDWILDHGIARAFGLDVPKEA